MRDLSPGTAARRPIDHESCTGADYDIVCLERDFGFGIRGLFDAQLIGMERIRPGLMARFDPNDRLELTRAGDLDQAGMRILRRLCGRPNDRRVRPM